MGQGQTDRRIEEQVWRALGWDSRVEDEGLGVQVRDGMATLLGTTPSYASKLAAEEAVQQVPGIVDVVDQVEVVVPAADRHEDAEIADAIETTFQWNPLVPAERIRCAVVDGWVTLGGTVDLLCESKDAERAVYGLEAVRGVSNEIRIGGPDVDSRVLRREIMDALERHARREATRIEIRVDAADVTLSGRVDSWSEKRTVLGVASHAPGVRAVHDALMIDQYSAGAPVRRVG